jgi:quinol monooxygenase YgiN
MAMAFVLAACGGQTARQDVGESQSQQVDDKMIRLNVFVTVAPGHIDEVLAGLNELAAASQKEEGCVAYGIFRNTVKPDELVIVETWAGDAALDAHKQTPHYTAILPPLADKMQMKLERFEFSR